MTLTTSRPLLINSPATLLAIVVMALVALGVIMVYSSSGARAGLEARRIAAANAQMPVESFEFHHNPAYLKRQVAWTFAGLISLVLLMKVPIERIERYAPHILLLALLMLLIVLVTPLGVTSKGARRWLRLGPFTIQPSEFAKIALVLYMARFLAIKREDIKNWKRGFLPTMAIWGVFATLIVLERDLGTVVLMGGVMVAMWLLAGMRLAHLGVLGAASVPILGYLLFQHSYRIQRVLSIFNPEQHALTTGYQLNQSLIAVGSGGWWGQGLGMGMQKYLFLTEAHTDFIFAIVCEELGLIGAICVVLLFLAFILLGFRVSYRAPDYFGGLAAAGLALTIGLAAFINFFVVLGMAPTKGLALPFFTYGGSAMIASLAAVGILINIANYTAESRGGA